MMKMKMMMRILLVMTVTTFGDNSEDMDMVIKNMDDRLTATEKELLTTKTELAAANIRQ